MAIATSLHKLSVEEGFVNNVSSTCMLRVGVDARYVPHSAALSSVYWLKLSGWIYRACYLHRLTKNPELATIFVWCMQLLQMPILPAFIFDGKGRPKLKRGKSVRGNAHWIIQDMKAMLDGFGFTWVEVVSFGVSNLAILMLASGSRRSWGRTCMDEQSWHNWCSTHRWLWCSDIWCSNHPSNISLLFPFFFAIATNCPLPRPRSDAGDGRVAMYKVANICITLLYNSSQLICC